MLCAISGEAPQHPVASRKSGEFSSTSTSRTRTDYPGYYGQTSIQVRLTISAGTVYEKSLIESYISQHGKDPVDGSELTLDDLVELRTARTVRPRPPNFTSIPSLISAFQNEWDALALETYELRQHLSQLRQELSTALYNNDAAVRVIARLTKERDEAREALGQVSVGGRGSSGVNGHDGAEQDDAMVVDASSMPSEVVAKIEETQNRLKQTRRKRPVPDGWATADTVQGLEPHAPTAALASEGRSLASTTTGDIVLAGGVDGGSVTFSTTSQEVLQTTQGNGDAVVDTVLCTIGQKVVPVIAKASGEVELLDGGKKFMSFKSHSGPAHIAIHPSQEILASVGEDKALVIYSLALQKEVAKIIRPKDEYTSCAFHPDGHLLVAGTKAGIATFFDVTTLETVIGFNRGDGDPVAALSFSENGYWLAVAYEGSTEVSIWDLRKYEEIKTLEFGGQVRSLRFDYTGQYLAGVGPAGLTVQGYDKGSKSWSNLLQKGLAARAVEWGSEAKSLVVLMADGSLTTLQ